MSITGPPPKEGRARRNAPTFKATEIVPDGKLRGPRLPKGYDWCDRTKEWWAQWRKSPQAMVMTETDWETMLETAFLHNMLWTPPSASSKANGAVSVTQLAAEIRQRVAKFGATFEDRMKLRLSIETPKSEADEEREIKRAASSAISYAERLLSATEK